MCNLQSTKKLLGLKGLKDILYYMSMQETDIMSELGDWVDVEAYPSYKISSTGAFMNKRTLKMLKHFVHVHGHGPVVTLYREGKGAVLSVKALLKDHFGAEAVLPAASYFSHKFTELAPPKAKAKSKKTQTD